MARVDDLGNPTRAVRSRDFITEAAPLCGSGRCTTYPKVGVRALHQPSVEGRNTLGVRILPILKCSGLKLNIALREIFTAVGMDSDSQKIQPSPP